MSSPKRAVSKEWPTNHFLNPDFGYVNAACTTPDTLRARFAAEYGAIEYASWFPVGPDAPNVIRFRRK